MVTHRGETSPSSDNFNERAQPDNDTQAVIERPPETDYSSQHTEQGPYVPDSLEGFNPAAQQTYVENPYAGQYRQDSFGTEPPVLAPEELHDARRRNFDMKDPSETIRRRNRVVAALVGVTGIVAVAAGAYFAGQRNDTAKALDEYRPGFPPNPPAATAPEVPGEGKLHNNMTPNEQIAFIHNYAKRNLSQDDLNKFEAISQLPVTGEFVIPGSTPEKSKTALHWYNNVVLGAIGDQVAADRNALAREQGYPEISPAAVDALKNGFDPNKTPDPKMLLDVFQLHIAAATSPYVSTADQTKLLKGAAASPNVKFTNTVKWSEENDKMFIFDTENVEASQVFNPDDPHILALKPGISYKKGAPIIVIHTDYTENTEGQPKSIPRQYTLRLETHTDPETGNMRIVPSAESIDNGGGISYFKDLTILNK